ncbi:hypothetical protein CR201_G0055518 [Pongo abelii]|uniref:Uncharacterized protein n=1 Tax=Pongo abelii TaxID=9601 RepID=A0A2J8QZU4_PONAB|nr:hypothetical protein CR201_G0055518 [Pongo abelii]
MTPPRAQPLPAPAAAAPLTGAHDDKDGDHLFGSLRIQHRSQPFAAARQAVRGQAGRRRLRVDDCTTHF